MKKLVAILSAVCLTACASIMHGTSQDIGISSSPSGAQVVIDNANAGAQTPYVAKISRGNNHIVKISMDGYEPAELTLTKSVSGWAWGNLVFGGIIGLAVDAMTGGLYSLNPPQLQAALARQGASVAPTKDGVYVVLVRRADPAWHAIGQLQRSTGTVVGQ